MVAISAIYELKATISTKNGMKATIRFYGGSAVPGYGRSRRTVGGTD